MMGMSVHHGLAGRPTNNPAGATEMARQLAEQSRLKNRRIRIALFCDALAAGEPDAPVTIKEAGRVAGVSEPTARGFFKEVCADLGWVGE